jgi:hypothetical protein
MARQKPRRRRTISARRVWMLKVVGFRHSLGRDAYVLRVVGNRFGPVFKVATEHEASADASARANTSQSTRPA